MTMRSWLAKDARAHLSDVIDEALKGKPQRVTRRGKGAVVVVSEEQWRRATSKQPDMTLGEYLATYPLSRQDVDLTAARGRERPLPFLDPD
jgi:antitoxin Phd